jgi:acetate kinase
MNNYLLIINAGSSSIKFALYQTENNQTLIADVTGQIEGIAIKPKFEVIAANNTSIVNESFSAEDMCDHSSALARIREWLDSYLANGLLIAVGHRVVHGGFNYIAPTLVTSKVLTDLETLIPLAPLHQPHNLATVRTLLETMPSLPQVVCFDTAFHNTQPKVAKSFALPRRFTQEGLYRYGFHGLSYEYITSRLNTLDEGLLDARIIVAHLGNGASMCAIENSKSIATTMGFSPGEGLVMGTRSGILDPGVLLYLMEHHKMNVRELEHLLYQESGLLGVSSISSDMRELLESDSPYAKEAIDLFVYRAGRELGSLVAALGGLDALIFTGGIGENSAVIREKICLKASWIGIELNQTANNNKCQRISMPRSEVSVWVVPTNENLMIAEHTLKLVTS